MTRRHHQPTRPMDLSLPGTMKNGAAIKLKGTLIDGAVKHFTIQLATPEGVALWMYVPVYGEILLNSYKNGRWELEERHFNPIKPCHHFHLKIKHRKDFLLIKVNGHTICHFFHRDMPQAIRTLVIRGDICVDDVRFKRFKHSHHSGGPAVVVHANLPPPPPVVQQIIVPQPQQQFIVQPMPQTIIQQPVQPVQMYPQIAPQGAPQPMVAAVAAHDVPPPYPAQEYPSIPLKM